MQETDYYVSNDLTADVGEAKNLVEVEPEVTKELTGKATAWYRAMKPRK